MADELLTPKELAREARVSSRTVYRWVREGWIRGGKIGSTVRIPRSELGRFREEAAGDEDDDDDT